MASLVKLARENLSAPGETLKDFQAEWTKLTDKDKNDLRVAFAQAGFEVD